MIETIVEPISEVFLMDCVEGMKQYPDKYFVLAVVDPPYGSKNIQGGYTKGIGGKGSASQKDYCKDIWEFEAPSEEYFTELFRISSNQIIWGANHFISKMPYDSSCWLIWDKQNENTGYADCEMAWTSFSTAVRKFTFRWNGMLQGNMKDKEVRIHPTQKPVALYDWIYKNYLPEGGKVLDSHLGSGSNRISAYKTGNIEFLGYEKSIGHYTDQEKRFQQFKSQLRLF